jgi:hypothetical protein
MVFKSPFIIVNLAILKYLLNKLAAGNENIQRKKHGRQRLQRP